MSALAANRDTREIAGELGQATVKSAVTIYAGALVALDADGLANPAANTAGLRVIGRAEHYATAGQLVTVKRGVFLFDNKAGDLVTVGDIGAFCYVDNDQSVQHTANSNVVVAGLVRGVTTDGVYVDTLMNPSGAVAGAAAGAAAIAADLADGSSTIKAAALVQGAAAIVADLADGSSTIKAAALTQGQAAVAAAGNMRLTTKPATAGATGVKGDVHVDGTDLYICTATNTWIKGTLTLATW